MRQRIVITTGAVVVVLATALAGAASGLADEPPAVDLEIGYPPPCGDEDATTLSAVDCAGVEPVDAIGPIDPEIEAAAAVTARADTALVAAGGPAALLKNCRLHAEVSMYTAADLEILAQHLAAEGSHCADHTVSIPAIAGNKTQPRPDQAWRIWCSAPQVPRGSRGSAHRLAIVGSTKRTRAGSRRQFWTRMAGRLRRVTWRPVGPERCPSTVGQATGSPDAICSTS